MNTLGWFNRDIGVKLNPVGYVYSYSELMRQKLSDEFSLHFTYFEEKLEDTMKSEFDCLRNA